MGIDSLRESVFGNPDVRDQLNSLIADSVCSQFSSSFQRSLWATRTTHDWPYLLLLASLFAGSEHGDHQDAALRVAQHCLQSSNTTIEQKSAAALILESLSNSPALGLAQARGLVAIGFEREIPLFLRMQHTRLRLETTINVGNGPSVRLNKFQQAFWERLNKSKWLSVSAPTSAGKSFVVTRWIIDQLSSGVPQFCIYLVPTRALIQQVEEDLRFHAKRADREIHITSVPHPSSLRKGISTICVFTQERLHVFLTAGPTDGVVVNYLVVDEAQKIGDRHRGVILQMVIEHVVEANPLLSVVFIAPMAANPGDLYVAAPPSAELGTLQMEETTVNQNLLWVSEAKGESKKWNVMLCLRDEQIPLGTLTLENVPSPESKRLPFVAHALASGYSGNIIYVNRAADAEITAEQLFDLLGSDADVENDPDIKALIQLVDQTIHSEYLLKKVLRRGIAFHYGNIPQTTRKAIERLFSTGIVRFLICTSTLIEGVNTSCRMISVRGPKKGVRQPMSAEDFWNLAGRAGRLGREFQGNVVCVDANKKALWEGGSPPKSRTNHTVRRTTDRILSDSGELIAFIKADTPRSEAEKRPDLEYTFTYLMACHQRYGGIAQAPWAQRYSRDAVQNLSEVITQAWTSIAFPHEIVVRNPTISPLAMQSLLNYFENRQKDPKKILEDLIPFDPANTEAAENFGRILARCTNHLVPTLRATKKYSFVLGILVVKWMRGLPLAVLVQDRIDYWTKGAGSQKAKRPTTAANIRGVLEDVERIARFEAPRAIAAYTDILRVFLLSIGRTDLAEKLVDFSVYLELGVSLSTQISLIGIGLSRATAIRLSEVIASDSLTEEQVLRWLKAYELESADLPDLMKQEVRQILSETIDIKAP